ncbi:uncharacterized protein LOC112510991 [Cynara cardunculus var. scolymus]|uniref:uncharacterized protein LOC112510991 n=1 Tax=Cynara cardunculus var. scolymus TaxID=59895 RepID=UPI000D630309|nr:uncharacterized protein LOC112510991 [Cynara cardunculus var. scolymus]
MMRIEMIRKRRKAMEKFLRNDVADLLKNGFDSDAYSRVKVGKFDQNGTIFVKIEANGLYFEQKRSLCYESIEQFCTVISNHLAVMNNQSECPEECREAVPSLMYAAARVAGLPELLELRNLFSGRYGNSLESFINKEFVKLFKPDHPTKDMKIQMMKEIALEHGIDWDPDSSERKSYKPTSSKHDSSKNTYGDQDNEPNRTGHENGQRNNVQETRIEDGDDRNRAEKNKENAVIEKQIDHMRERLSTYWSRTTSLFSSSRETSTSTTPEESSSDDPANQRSFFPFRFMPPPYLKPDRSRDHNKENQEVLNHPNIEIWDGEPTAPPNVKSRRRRRRRRGRAPPQAKSHSTECLPNPVAMEAQKGHVRSASYQPESTVRPTMGHVHPKLPDYDDIIARFAALRAKS